MSYIRYSTSVYCSYTALNKAIKHVKIHIFVKFLFEWMCCVIFYSSNNCICISLTAILLHKLIVLRRREQIWWFSEKVPQHLIVFWITCSFWNGVVHKRKDQTQQLQRVSFATFHYRNIIPSFLLHQTFIYEQFAFCGHIHSSFIHRFTYSDIVVK